MRHGTSRWLGLILPYIVNQSTEEYMQEHIFKPLGMHDTTFYPFSSIHEGRLMPLRYFSAEDKEWQVLQGQMEGLTLPRR